MQSIKVFNNFHRDLRIYNIEKFNERTHENLGFCFTFIAMFSTYFTTGNIFRRFINSDAFTYLRNKEKIFGEKKKNIMIIMA